VEVSLHKTSKKTRSIERGISNLLLFRRRPEKAPGLRGMRIRLLKKNRRWETGVKLLPSRPLKSYTEKKTHRNNKLSWKDPVHRPQWLSQGKTAIAEKGNLLQRISKRMEGSSLLLSRKIKGLEKTSHLNTCSGGNLL